MSRRLIIGLFALIVAMAATIGTLVLVREEPPPSPLARNESAAAPDATNDATAEEQRRAAAAAAAAAAGAQPAPPPPPPASDTAALPTLTLPATPDPPAREAPAVSESPPPAETPAVAESPTAAGTGSTAEKQEAAAREPLEPQPGAQEQAPPQAQERKEEPAPPQEAARQEVTAPPQEASRKEEEPAPAPPPAAQAPPPPEAPKPAAQAPEGQPAPQAPAISSPAPPPVEAPRAPPVDPPAVASPAPQPAPAVAAAPPPLPPPPAPRRVAPSFDVVRIAVDGTTVIAGRAEPGALVQVFDGEKEIGRTTADSRGEWVLLPTGAMAPGTRELSLVAKGPGDIPEIRSERVVVVVVPERQQAAQTGGALAVSVPRDPTGTEPSRALQVPNPAPRQAPPISLAVETVDYDAAGNVVLAGRCAPGGTVLVYLDGKVIGRAVADGDGRWSLTPEGTVVPGVYTLRVDQLGADGRVAQRMEMPFSRAEPTAELASAGNDRIIVQPGNSLWRIARRVYGEGTRYSVIYQANREMIRDPDLIYPGQVFALPPGQAPAR